MNLTNDAHIQTTDNFKDGKIATHNDKIDYQKRHNDWKDNFQKNDDGTVKMKYDRRSNSEKEVLVKGARDSFDKERPTGNKTVNKDHVVSAAEIIRDPAANAHLDKDEQINFANSNKNLQDLDSAANQSKNDLKMNEWLDSERNGQKPADRYPINEDELREADKIAREEYKKQKEEGELKSIETGKQSQKEEAFRIGGKALRALIMQFLVELIKSIFSKLILWFKSAKKSLDSLIASFKSSISSFISNMKNHLINAGNTIGTTIFTAIFGPIVRTVKKVWTLLKQGWASLKEAIAYLRNPENRNKPFDRLILEVGKIVVAGLSTIGAIALGEVIEKGLMMIPVFAIEIPMLGSLASLLGLFLGGLVAGVIGAIALTLIDKVIAKRQKSEAIVKEINKGNKVLNIQNKLIAINEAELEYTKENAIKSISDNHKKAAKIIKETIDNISIENRTNEVVNSGNEARLDNIINNLKKLSK